MISERIEEREKESYFNAKVREEGGPFMEMLTEEKIERRFKDKVNTEGRKLIEGLRKKGWIP